MSREKRKRNLHTIAADVILAQDVRSLWTRLVEGKISHEIFLQELAFSMGLDAESQKESVNV
jgi:hypothetical protein